MDIYELPPYITVNNISGFIEYVDYIFNENVFKLDLENINRLCLTVCNFIDYDILEKFLADNNQITTLTINNEKINKKDINKIILLMMKNTTIHQFNLYVYGNKIDNIDLLFKYNRSIISFEIIANTTYEYFDIFKENRIYFYYDSNHKITNDTYIFMNDLKLLWVYTNQNINKLIAINSSINNIINLIDYGSEDIKEKIEYIHSINCNIKGINKFKNLKVLRLF
jgi:hypothetical protein